MFHIQFHLNYNHAIEYWNKGAQNKFRDRWILSNFYIYSLQSGSLLCVLQLKWTAHPQVEYVRRASTRIISYLSRPQACKDTCRARIEKLRILELEGQPCMEQNQNGTQQTKVSVQFEPGLNRTFLYSYLPFAEAVELGYYNKEAWIPCRSILLLRSFDLCPSHF